jgi:hypothetical protein
MSGESEVLVPVDRLPDARFAVPHADVRTRGPDPAQPRHGRGGQFARIHLDGDPCVGRHVEPFAAALHHFGH